MSDNQTASLALQLKAMEDENLQLKIDIAALKSELTETKKSNTELKNENNDLRNRQLLLDSINVGIMDETATSLSENEARPIASRSTESSEFASFCFRPQYALLTVNNNSAGAYNSLDPSRRQ